MASQKNTSWKHTLYEQVGRKIRHTRELHNLSIKTVATKLGMTPNAVSLVENGGPVSLAFLVMFSQLTRTGLDMLVPDVPCTFQREIEPEDT